MSNPFQSKPEEGGEKKKLGIFDAPTPSAQPETSYKFGQPAVNKNPTPSLFG